MRPSCGLIPRLQEQAAASLSGLDARKVKSFEFGATHLVYDPTGQRC